MWKIALRGFRASFIRFLLTLLSVILGSAFLTGTLALRDSLQSQFLSIAQTTQLHDLYVEGAQRDGGIGASENGPTRMELPETLTDELTGVPGVARAMPEYAFVGGLEDASGHSLTGDTFAPTIITGEYFPGTEYGELSIDGQLPTGREEVVVEAGSATALGLRAGDELRIVYADIVQPVTVVGIANYGSTMAGANVLLMDGDAVRDILLEQRATMIEAQVRAEVGADPELAQLPEEMAAKQIDAAVAQSLSEAENDPLSVPAIAIEVEDSADTEQVREDLTSAIDASWRDYEIPDEPEVLTRDQTIDEINEHIETQVGFVNIFLLIFVGIALFVSIFIISNTFRMIVHSQLQQFAMLRAIGASRRHIFAIVTAQGLGIGVIGSALGILLGAGLAQGLKGLLAKFSLVLTDIPVSPTVMATTMIVGVTVTFLGALFPARSAAKIPPVAAMREAQLAGQEVAPWTAFGGAFLLAVGTGLWWASTNPDHAHPGPVLAAGIVTGLIGLLLLTPALTIPLITVLGAAWRGATGRLARGNVLRNPRRTAATASALTIGVSLVVLGAVLAETMRDATAGVIDEQLRSEFTVVSQGGQSIDSTELISSLRAIDGVDYVNDNIAGITLAVRPQGEENYIQDIMMKVDPAAIGRDFIIPDVEGDLEQFTDGGAGTPILVSSRAARSLDIAPGDPIMLKGDKAEREGTCVAVIESAVLKRDFTITDEDAEELGAPTFIKSTLLITAKDDADLTKVKEQLDEAVADYDGLIALTKEQYKDQIADIVNIMLGIVYALLGLSMIIAVFGIINTQSLSIGERIREIGLLRAIGLGRGRIAGMVLIESILTALLGTLLGFLAGTAISRALIDYLIRADLGISRFVFPAPIIAYTIIGAVLIGSLAGIVPAIRAARIRLLTAIATD
ncbi:MAG: ABC transporter permease [Flaviflexus sp.]|nr:ABC transporter permease [Flaviflexus sp.]